MTTPSTTWRSALVALLALFLPAVLLGACGGGSGGGGSSGAGVVPPTELSYDVAPGLYRVNEAIPPNTASVTGGPASVFTIDPALPAGLVMDPATGTISGTPTALQPLTMYEIMASNSAGMTGASLGILVGPELPSALVSLAPGFFAESVFSSGTKMAKAVLTPGGRFLFTEVDAGTIRVIDPQLGLLPNAYVTITVTNGGHQGLLGLALSPDFVNDGFVYVQATIPGAQAQDPDQTVVYRYTDDPQQNVGTNETVVVSALPASTINNGGELLFDLEGHLMLSLGDNEVPANAQQPFATSPSGKVMRYDVTNLPDGVPATNPDPQSPEWCRGLRNTFGLAVHPLAGTVMGADNGPTADDELNLLVAGNNYEWGAVAPVQNQGRRLVRYPTVIVPTALTYHDGTNWPSDYANDLFMTSYDDQVVRRFQVSGPTFSEIDDEEVFAEFALQADDNKPLDLFQGSDGSLYVVTFKGIWRIGAMDSSN